MKAYIQPFKILPGVLSNEKNVVIEDYNGTKTFGFFDIGHIYDGKLEVEVCNEEYDVATVKLPERTIRINKDNDYLAVKKDKIEYSPK
jgi:hypothetical protein